MKKIIKSVSVLFFCIIVLNILAQDESYNQYVTFKYENNELKDGKIENGYWICDARLDQFNDTFVKSLGDEISKFNIINQKDSLNVARIACYSHCLAAYYYRNMQDNEAIEQSKKAIELRERFDDGLLWKSYLNLGVYLNTVNNYVESIQFLEKSVNEQKHVFKPKIGDKNIIMTHRFLAKNYAELGEFDKAILNGKRAINVKSINNSMTKVDSFELAASYLEYSNVLIRKKELKYLNRAITLLDTSIIFFGDNEVKIKSINNKAIAYRYLKKHKEAFNFYNEALAVNTDKFDLFKARIRGNIGALLTEQKKYEEATIKLKASLSQMNHLLDNDEFNYIYAINYVNLGESYEGSGNLNEALHNYHLTLINRTNNFRETDTFKNPIINDDLYVHDNVLFIENLNAKARVALKMYQQNLYAKYLDLANDTYETAFAFHSRLYNDITTESSRLLQAKTIMPFIENALKVQYEYQQLDKDYASNAFKFMELNKASVLMQSINESQALTKAGIPEDSLRKEKSLRVQITELQKKKNTLITVGGKEHKKIENELAAIKDQHDYLIRQFENNYPAYKNLKYQPSELQLSEVQQQLDNSTAILEYFVGDSTIYVMTIQKEQVDFYKIDKPIDWSQKMGNFMATITNPDTIDYKNMDTYFLGQLNEMYQLLVEKPIACLNADIKHLQIIPDAELNNIPFAALITKPHQNSSIDFSKLDYLAHQFYISYAYSTKLLTKAQQEKRQTTFGTYAAFLADDPDQINPYCDQQVGNISTKLNGKIYMGTNCTFDSFKAVANDYSTVNLIMHGCGTLGALNFNDGEFFDTEIYNLDLSNTQLVNLTACETNVGVFKKGEGLMSLSRAFTFAGCPSLVSTLWSVNSLSTCNITEWFFDEIKNGKSVDIALWEAQKKYLSHFNYCEGHAKECRKAHPFYWAGIIPIGKMAPITFKK